LSFGFTVRLPLTGRLFPYDAASPPTNDTEVAFDVVQVSTTGAPCTGENSGLALNVRIMVEPTFTVTLAVDVPVELVAVKV